MFDCFLLKCRIIHRCTVVCFIGKVNAAICTQILADHFDVDLVINTGIAGSLDAAIDIGDMVISTDAVQHDMDTSIFGDPIGQVPRMDTFAFPAAEFLTMIVGICFYRQDLKAY